MKIKLAHVLFLDIVGYSKLLTDYQTNVIARLQDIVRATAGVSHARAEKQLILLPTGDGMALVFFGDPDAPARCALEVGAALKRDPEIRLRMGIHTGPVNEVRDVNGNVNVAGDGINTAQRVMDCGDTGHILLSKRTADDLGQYSDWHRHLHDLGEVEVKHGVRVHVVNLYTGEVGNPALPEKLRKKRKPALSAKAAAGLALLLVAGLAAAGWMLHGRSASDSTAPAVGNVPAAQTPTAERSLSFWFMVASLKQKGMRPSLGTETFFTGEEFEIVVKPTEAGSLYLINRGKDKRGNTEWVTLFPTPINGNGDARLEAHKEKRIQGARFTGGRGQEEIYFIWSPAPLERLEAAIKDSYENRNRYRLTAAGTAALQNLLEATPTSTVSDDEDKRLVTLKGRGEILIGVRKIRHEDP